AGGMPIAVGAGLTSKMKGLDHVAVSFFGDGASNEGVFHEAINLAALWKLPVIFVCENNGYGISVPQRESTSVNDISVRSAAYGIPGVTVDGNDVFAVDEAIKMAITRARAGEGPTLIECKTYRWMGHWTGDPQVYRSREEVAEWKKKCPIKRLRGYLLEKKLSTEKELDALESDVQSRVEAAAKFSEDSPEPDPANVLDDVFYVEKA
ncbi:MAG: thiamine pyrophosphate-dependent dehydrogenase E1 component subunit alpha, partial [Clostridia bacterium]|nr:thiamine pyrophosphate-dependent dehydrogenase E1 component subunit alpha [Clostridia bacterium]